MKFGGAGKFRGSAKEIEDIFDQLASTAALNRRAIVLIDDIDRPNATDRFANPSQVNLQPLPL
jgi:hypothetical protein